MTFAQLKALTFQDDAPNPQIMLKPPAKQRLRGNGYDDGDSNFISKQRGS